MCKTMLPHWPDRPPQQLLSRQRGRLIVRNPMKARIIPIVRTVRATLPPGRDLVAPPEGALVDLRGRRVRDLRISVTDRCNFRCVYCMPKEVFGDDYAFLPRSKLLSFEEIVRVARVFVEHG